MAGREDGKVLFLIGIFLGVDGGSNTGHYRSTLPGKSESVIGTL
jgi:hypothetical protein